MQIANIDFEYRFSGTTVESLEFTIEADADMHGSTALGKDLTRRAKRPIDGKSIGRRSTSEGHRSALRITFSIRLRPDAFSTDLRRDLSVSTKSVLYLSGIESEHLSAYMGS
jgi:hypothetical protein